jgi:allophanate hydrolase subunit 2
LELSAPPAGREISAELLGELSRFGVAEETVWLRGRARAFRFDGVAAVPLLRVVAGPQEEIFTEEGIDTFYRSSYTVSADSNRMAAKLDGPEIQTVQGSDIISDGIVEGSVQVSSNGRPILMLADHQTAGGYAKIGTCIRADIPVLAQLRPGERVAFTRVTPDVGIRALRDAEKQINHWKEIWK